MPRKTKEVKKIEPISNNTNTTKSVASAKNKSITSTKAKMAVSTKTKSTTSTKSTVSTSSKTKVEKNTKAKVIKSTKTKITKSDLVSVMEYYDLPYRYNQTIVKILAQTPNMLFVYWDISDIDIKSLEEHYGNDFFKKTKPILIIHNKTMNYSFEVEINDFANSWYLHVNDANCKYEIELGRRPFNYTYTINEDYIHISSSNEMDAPNNHILFEKFNPNVTYKNAKTGATSKKDFSSIANYKNIQEIYNIHDLYKTIYKEDLFNEIASNNLSNPSSLSSY